MTTNDYNESAARGAICRAIAELTRALQRSDYAAAEQHAAIVLGGVQLLRHAARMREPSVQIRLTEVES